MEHKAKFQDLISVFEFQFLSCWFICFVLFFNWGTGALQCCAINSLYCIAKWIGYWYTYAPSLQCFPPLPPPVPLACHRAPCWASCAIQQVPTPCLMQNSAHPSPQSLSSHPPQLPCPPACSLHMCLYLCSINRFICNIFLFSKGLYLTAVSLVINSHFQV